MLSLKRDSTGPFSKEEKNMPSKRSHKQKKKVFLRPVSAPPPSFSPLLQDIKKKLQLLSSQLSLACKKENVCQMEEKLVPASVTSDQTLSFQDKAVDSE